MLQSFEGIYKNGAIELLEFPGYILESRVIMTFLPDNPTTETSRLIRFGMFAGARQSSEANFELAQFREDGDDDLEVQ